MKQRTNYNYMPWNPFSRSSKPMFAEYGVMVKIISPSVVHLCQVRIDDDTLRIPLTHPLLLTLFKHPFVKPLLACVHLSKGSSVAFKWYDPMHLGGGCSTRYWIISLHAAVLRLLGLPRAQFRLVKVSTLPGRARSRTCPFYGYAYGSSCRDPCYR